MNERLQEIKESRKLPCTYVTENSERKGYYYDLMDVDFHWLIEQAEKVKRYEQSLKNIYNWETRTDINKTVHLSESAILAKQALEGGK